MLKARCPECAFYSFIENGFSACCGAQVTSEPQALKREAKWKHAQPPIGANRIRRLAMQHHRCLFCERPFGSRVWRVGRRNITTLYIRWECELLFKNTNDGVGSKPYAVCQICKRLTHFLTVPTIEKAKVYVATKRDLNGWRDIPTPEEMH